MVLVKQNVSLKDYSSFKIGGSAKYFAEAQTIEELLSVLIQWRKISRNFPQKDQKIFILSGGTNLLVSDSGFDGLVIHNRIKFIERQNDESVWVGAGVLVSDLLSFCINNSLSGLEWAGGLPGTVGGAARGNAGAFGGEVKDSVAQVETLKISSLEIKKRTGKECKFSYRQSCFKKGDGESEIILSVIFKLTRGSRKNIERSINEKITYRKNRHPLEYPNIGSIFKNIPLNRLSKKINEEFSKSIKNDPFPVLPAAKLLAVSGLMGKRVGGAQVSIKHPNFIVNLGNAKSMDVLSLIRLEKEVIFKKYGIRLEEEITYLSDNPERSPA